MQEKILLIEDDLELATIMTLQLQQLALDVTAVSTLNEAQRALQHHHFALTILDLTLPDGDGLSLCGQLRLCYPTMAIVLTTAKSSELDRILGLEMGADDYICKPFSLREFQARIKVQLRRIALLTTPSQPSPHNRIHLGCFELDSLSREVHIQGKQLSLTATEFELLHFFAKHPNQVFSRAQLLDSVWGYLHDGYEHTVNSHINRLRLKLTELGMHDLILTVWGVGYKFNDKQLRRGAA